MKAFGYGLVAGLALLLILFFAYHLPEIEKAKKEERARVAKDIDTIFLPGKPIPVYRDTTIFVTVKDSSIKQSGDTIRTSMVKSILSGKDTISAYAEVTLIDEVADWILEIFHRDVETIKVDSFKIYTPQYVEIPVEVQGNILKRWEAWLLILLAVIGFAI